MSELLIKCIIVIVPLVGLLFQFLDYNLSREKINENIIYIEELNLIMIESYCVKTNDLEYWFQVDSHDNLHIEKWMDQEDLYTLLGCFRLTSKDITYIGEL